MSIYILFNGEEKPISTLIESTELHTWYSILFLILSNLAYVPLIYYLFRVGASSGASLVCFSAIISILYHICQTLTYCFLHDIAYWTMSDHTFALLFLAVIFLFTVNSPSKKLCDQWRKWRFQRDWRKPDTMIYDQWTGSVTVVFFGLVVMAVHSHPYSSQSYLVGITFGLCLVLFKFLILEQGEIDRFSERLSVLDLCLGLGLFFVGIICFQLDGSITYWAPHFLWHFFSGLGLFFYCAGVSAHLDGHFSPSARISYYFNAYGT